MCGGLRVRVSRAFAPNCWRSTVLGLCETRFGYRGRVHGKNSTNRWRCSRSTDGSVLQCLSRAHAARTRAGIIARPYARACRRVAEKQRDRAYTNDVPCLGKTIYATTCRVEHTRVRAHARAHANRMQAAGRELACSSACRSRARAVCMSESVVWLALLKCRCLVDACACVLT